MSRDGSIKNPYAFASNDPVNFADPTGLDSALEWETEAETEAKEEKEFENHPLEDLASFMLPFGYGDAIGGTALLFLHAHGVHGVAEFEKGFAGKSLKWSGRVSSLADIGLAAYRGYRYPSGENKGRFYVTLAESAALELDRFHSPILSAIGKGWFFGSKIGMWRWERQQDELRRAEFRIGELIYPIHLEVKKSMRVDLPKRMRELIKGLEASLKCPTGCSQMDFEAMEAELSDAYRILYWGGAGPERDINPVPPQLTLRREQSVGPPISAKTASDVWSGLPLPPPLPPAGCNLAESRC